MGLRDLTPVQFARLSSLLDEALERPAGERAAWIASVAARDGATGKALRDLVAAAEANADGFLETRDLVDRRLERAAAASGSFAGRTIGPWRVLRLLGRGGMGTVWLAERADGLFRRQVALKLMHQHLAAGAVGRFAREREILGALDHPNIARLLDAGVVDEGRPYLVLEHVDGEPLTAWCDARRLPLAARVALARQVTGAVAYAHANLVIHRDLKPSNVLVAADGTVRLLDFGVAKLVGEEAAASNLTEIAGPAFTPDYAAPEQVGGGTVTTASDVYALGVVFYELFCGCRPYRLARATRGALEEAILAAEPPRASQAAIDDAIAAARATTVRRLRRSLAGDLDTIVGKALRKEPAQRYATADALAQDLDRHLRGEPVLARPAGAAYHLRKFVARNRWSVAAGALTAGALAAGAMATAWQAHVATAQAARAEREAVKATVVQDFLLDLFRANSVEQPDPLRAQRTTARDLLDLGAKRASAALAGSPEAQVEVLGTLAAMYYQLGLTDEAALRHGEAVASARRAFAPDDPRRAAALMSYADAIVDSARRGELLPVLDEARAVLDAAGDATSPVRGRLLSMYAKAHAYTSAETAQRYADAALAFYRRHHPATPQARAALQAAAAARQQVGDHEGAEALYREALADARRPGGPPASQVVPLVGVAVQRAALGDVEGAERHYREALAVSRAAYGEAHGETLQSQVKLARHLHGTARRDEARRLMEEAAATATAQGAALPDFVGAVIAAIRGLALLQEGRPDDAAPLIAIDLADARANYPRSAPLASALYAHAMLQHVRGDHAAALAALDEAAAIEADVASGAGSARANRYRLERARVLVAAGEPAQALAELERVARPRAAQHLPLVVQDVQRRIVAADALLALGRASDAAVQARQALSQVEAAPTRRYHALLEADAAQRLGTALLHAGDAAAARPLLERAVALRQRLDAPASPWLAQARVALAADLRALGDAGAALPLELAARDAAAAHTRLAAHFAAAPAARVEEGRAGR